VLGASNIRWSSVWNLFRVTDLAPRILSLLLDILKFVHHLIANFLALPASKNGMYNKLTTLYEISVYISEYILPRQLIT
jgi:hypothetical protein